MKITTILFLLVLAIPVISSAQQLSEIEAVFDVYDADTNETIHGAKVVLTNAADKTYKDQIGIDAKFRAEVTLSANRPSGITTITVSAAGYVTEVQKESLDSVTGRKLFRFFLKPMKPQCSMTGSWKMTIKGLHLGKPEDTDESTWTIPAEGIATEAGIGSVRGNARIRGRMIVIKWWSHTPEEEESSPYKGTLTVNLNPDCNSGTGQVKFTKQPGDDKRDGPFEVISFTRIN